MSNTFIMDHPLVKHKITLLRDENTGTKDFRTLVGEIGSLMAYEALRDLPTELVSVKSPVAESMQPVIAGKKLAVLPILRYPACRAWHGRRHTRNVPVRKSRTYRTLP